MNVFLPYHCFMKQLKVIKQHFFSLTQLNFWNQALAEAEGTYGSSRDWFRTYRGPVPNSSFSTVKRTTQYRGPSLVWNGTNQAKEQVSYRTAVLRTARAVKRTHSFWSLYSKCEVKSNYWKIVKTLNLSTRSSESICNNQIQIFWQYTFAQSLHFSDKK